MLQWADGYRPDVIEGRWVIETQHHRASWEVIVEPDFSGPGVVKVNIMAKWTRGNDSDGVGDTHLPCTEPVRHLPVHSARCRTLSLRPRSV
jgi:hypothetical protein